MKRNLFKFALMISAISIFTTVSGYCTVALNQDAPLFAENPITGDSTHGSATETAITIPEEQQLTEHLEADGLISQIKGYVVEKSDGKLYIDGQEQSAAIAKKYLTGLKKDEISVQVYPFMERLQMHPDASFLQILLPTSFSSPCVARKPKKGC